jgi:hypothetical protein
VLCGIGYHKPVHRLARFRRLAEMQNATKIRVLAGWLLSAVPGEGVLHAGSPHLS